MLHIPFPNLKQRTHWGKDVNGKIRVTKKAHIIVTNYGD